MIATSPRTALALSFVLFTLAGPARADTPAKSNAKSSTSDVVEKLQHGQVNWSKNTILATGSGAANLKKGPIAVARLGAERAATMDAYRNLLETVKGVCVSGKKNAGSAFKRGTIESSVQGIVQGARRVDTRYYDDGSVDVVLEMPLDEKLRAALGLKAASKAVEVSAKGDKKYTGLVIDATGLKARAALAPRVLDPKGKVLYSKAVAADQLNASGGLMAYASNVDEAKKHDRAGGSPLVVKAKKLGKKGPSDYVLSKEDAESLRADGIDYSFLKNGKVVVALGK